MQLINHRFSRMGLAALGILMGLALAAVPMQAQHIRAVSLALDNDGFNFWLPPHSRTDWFYTHGTRLEAVLAWRPPGLGALGFSDAPPCGAQTPEGACTVSRIRIAQEIYTPENLFFYTTDMEDRPYAGWLYLTMAAERVAPRRTHGVSLELGVTGPPSLGRQVHKGFHRWLDKYPPQGWEYQIPFEVAVAATYRETRRYYLLPADASFSAAIQPHVQGTVGTVRTSGEAGVGLRLGWHAPPGVDWRGPATRGFYVLAQVGAEGELVLRDLFLDGSTWRHSPSVEKKPILGRARGRVQIGWKGVGLEFDVTRSTREFRGQDKGHSYGTLSLFVRP